MPQIAHLAWGITVTCMVSFGDSKHEPVEPLHSLLDVTPLKLALSAKCTIHDVELNPPPRVAISKVPDSFYTSKLFTKKF
jgi:hypothetical protein